MKNHNFRVELKRFADSQLVKSISKQLKVYEKRVQQIVKELNLKSRDAREKGRQQLDKFAAQLKRTRREVEKKVQAVVNQEGKRLNKGLGELVDYLKSVAKTETAAAKAGTSKKKTSKVRAKAGATPKKELKEPRVQTSVPTVAVPAPSSGAGVESTELTDSSS